MICTSCGQEIDEDDDICPHCHTILFFDCPLCSFELTSGTDQCPNCDALIPSFCVNCHSPLPVGIEVCPQCHTPLHVTRRQSARIIHSLVVGDLVVSVASCPSCGSRLHLHEGQCASCGYRFCPQCQISLEKDEEICPRCGPEKRRWWSFLNRQGNARIARRICKYLKMNARLAANFFAQNALDSSQRKMISAHIVALNLISNALNVEKLSAKKTTICPSCGTAF